jgi:hypothetical protein
MIIDQIDLEDLGDFIQNVDTAFTEALENALEMQIKVTSFDEMETLVTFIHYSLFYLTYIRRPITLHAASDSTPSTQRYRYRCIE